MRPDVKKEPRQEIEADFFQAAGTKREANSRRAFVKASGTFRKIKRLAAFVCDELIGALQDFAGGSIPTRGSRLLYQIKRNRLWMSTTSRRELVVTPCHIVLLPTGHPTRLFVKGGFVWRSHEDRNAVGIPIRPRGNEAGDLRLFYFFLCV